MPSWAESWAHCASFRNVWDIYDNGQHDDFKCICDSSQGNTREPDMNGGGRRRTCVWGRVGFLLSSLGSLEGTLLGLLTLPHSFCLTMTDLNNLSHIIYLSHNRSHNHLLIDTNTRSHTCLKVFGPGSHVERAGIWAEGNLIGIPYAKHMRSPWLTGPACPATHQHHRCEIKITVPLEISVEIRLKYILSLEDILS